MPRTLIPTFYTPQRRATLMAPGFLPDQRRQRPPAMPYGASQGQAGPFAQPMMPQVDPSQRPLNQFGRPTGMSPNFAASIQTNRAAQGIQRNRQANALEANRAGIEKAGGDLTMGPPPQMPMSPGAPQRTMSMQVEKRPAVQGQRGETDSQYANAIMQQERNANVMANRGISIPAAPFRPQQTAVEGVPMGFTNPITRPIVPPAGNYGLSQDQLSGIQRNADQQAYIQYQREMGALQNPPPPMMPVPADVLKQQVAMAQQQVGYERQRAGDAERGARQPGQATQARDTRGDNLTRQYQSALEGGQYDVAEEIRKQYQSIYGEQPATATQGAGPTPQPSAATTQPSGKAVTPAQGGAPAPEGQQMKTQDGTIIVKRGGVWVRADTGQPYQPS